MITLGNGEIHMTVTLYHAADNIGILCHGKLKENLRLLLTCVFYFRPTTSFFTGLQSIQALYQHLFITVSPKSP